MFFKLIRFKGFFRVRSSFNKRQFINSSKEIQKTSKLISNLLFMNFKRSISTQKDNVTSFKKYKNNIISRHFFSKKKSLLYYDFYQFVYNNFLKEFENTSVSLYK